MNVWVRDDHSIRLSLLGLSITFLYLLVLLPLGFLEQTRAGSADSYLRWRTALFGPPRQVQDLLLVTIDDESQRELNQKWPWDRIVFSDFLHRVASHSPKLILFDLAFVGESRPESDASLAEAIRQGPRTLLASYLDGKGDPMLPLPKFVQAGGVPAFINKPLDRDGVVRRMWVTFHLPGYQGPLYGIEASAAACLWGVPREQIHREGSTLSIGRRRLPLGRLGEMPINYLAFSESVPTVSFWRILRGEISSDQLRNKLIIVGSTREITHDIHPTPLERMPGISIEANGILTLVTERFLRDFPLSLGLFLSLFFVVGIMVWTYRASLPAGFLTAAGLTGLAVAGGFLLTCGDVSAEFASPIILGTVSWLTGFFYKHLVLVAGALRLQRQAVVDLLTGAFTARYFRLCLQEIFARSRRSRRPFALLLVEVVPSRQLLQGQPWEQVRDRMRMLVEFLRSKVPVQAFVGRLEEDRLGLLLVNVSTVRADEISRRLQERLRSFSEVLAFGLACSDQAALNGGEDLILCAESALKRAKSRAMVGAATVLEAYNPAVDQQKFGPAVGKGPRETASSHLEYVASELEERNRSLESALSELRQVHQQLEASFLEVTKSLVLALETKDAYTAGHLERVCRYATRLAEALQLPKEEVEAVREAALLHDIGKIGLPDEVLHKVGKLTDEEKGIIKQHLSIGAKILEPMKFFKSITKLIYHHHEWYNGQGYPHGLAGDFIPPGAQIIAIADAFDAMTTHRSYNSPMSSQEALEEIRRGMGAQFNPLYVEKFIEVITREGPRAEAGRVSL